MFIGIGSLEAFAVWDNLAAVLADKRAFHKWLGDKQAQTRRRNLRRFDLNVLPNHRGTLIKPTGLDLPIIFCHD